MEPAETPHLGTITHAEANRREPESGLKDSGWLGGRPPTPSEEAAHIRGPPRRRAHDPRTDGAVLPEAGTKVESM